jgi:hypothetical protein
MVSKDEITKKAFADFTATVVRSIAMRNANIGATKVSEVVG